MICSDFHHVRHYIFKLWSRPYFQYNVIQLLHYVYYLFISIYSNSFTTDACSTYMARLPRSVEKPEQVSLRLPKDLATKVDYFKDKEGVDRSTIIIRALRYWLEVDGHVTTDHEFMKRLDTIESESEMLRKTFQQNIEKTAVAFEKERQTYQELILKQQLTIDALLELVAKREK